MMDQTTSIREFIVWAKHAQPGHLTCYHAGNLAIDRLAHPEIAELATLTSILAGTNYPSLRQYRSAPHELKRYRAAKTGFGRFPRSLVSQEADPTDYTVLKALKSARHDPSVARVVRGVPDAPQGASAARKIESDDRRRRSVARHPKTRLLAKASPKAK